AEEGVVQVFRPVDGTPALVGVVGTLQLDVLKTRLADEYGVEIGFETSQFALARWVGAEDRAKLDAFLAANRSAIAEDGEGDPVILASSTYALQYVKDRHPEIRFTDVKELHAGARA